MAATARDTPQSRTTALPGLSLHHLEWTGAGRTVVLLHPNRTNARVWDFAVDAMRRRDRVIALDHRGHGDSGWPEHGYQLEDYVTDDIAFIEALGSGPVDLVGAATGGNIALLLASARPELVRTLMVLDPGLSLDPDINRRVQEEIASAHALPSRRAAMDSMPFSDLWSPAMRAHYAEHGFRDNSDGTVSGRYRPKAAQETEAALEAHIWDRIAVQAPLMAVRGALSPVFDRPRMLRLARVVPQAMLVEVPRASHRVMQDNPRFVASLIDGFLDATELAPSTPTQTEMA